MAGDTAGQGIDQYPNHPPADRLQSVSGPNHTIPLLPMIRRPLLALLIVLATVPLRAEDTVVSFTALVYRFFENAGTGGVTVTRTGSPLTSVSIPYHYVIDTTVTDGTFTFAPNETSKTFLLPVPNDGVFDNANSEFQNYFVELRPVSPVFGGSILHTRIQLMEAQPEPILSLLQLMK